MNNSPVKSELYVALEMVELTQFLPFTKIRTLPKMALKKVLGHLIFTKHKIKAGLTPKTTALKIDSNEMYDFASHVWVCRRFIIMS